MTLFTTTQRPSGKVAATYERQVFHGDSPRQIRALRATLHSFVPSVGLALGLDAQQVKYALLPYCAGPSHANN